jgi:hypothetical protein
MDRDEYFKKMDEIVTTQKGTEWAKRMEKILKKAKKQHKLNGK